MNFTRIKKQIICCIIIFAVIFLIISLHHIFTNNKLNTNEIKNILLHNNLVNNNISHVEVLYCKKVASRDDSGWNIILRIKTSDIDFSRLTLLDIESKNIFMEWFKQTDFFAKNTSFIPSETSKLYRPSKTDGIGFPAIFCENQKSIIFLYNTSKLGNTTLLAADRSFEEINQTTSWIWLKKAVKNMETSTRLRDFSRQNYRDHSFYAERYEKINRYLYLAAKKPPVDFSCCKTSSVPAVIESTDRIPDCIRSLMLDYAYGIEIGNPGLIHKALSCVLLLDSVLGKNPYIYYQLVRAANINIIFYSIRKSFAESPLNLLSVKEINELVTLLKRTKSEIKISWEHALEFESAIDFQILQKKLPFIESIRSNKTKMESCISRYRRFLLSASKAIKNTQNDETAMNILRNESEKINEFFYTPIVGSEWIRTKQQTTLKLDAIICLLECVEFYKIHGYYPPKRSILTQGVEYVPKEKGFDLIIGENEVLAYGYKIVRPVSKSSLKNLFQD